LCGTGVTSEMLVILKPTAFNARTADSRPGPGPLMRTSMFFTPDSWARRPACSAATCAANGVLLREPLKPLLPEVALAVGNGDDGVVEGSVNVRDAFRDVLLDLLAHPGACFRHGVATFTLSYL